MRTIRQHGFTRLGRLAGVAALLDLAIAVVLVAHLAGGIASGASAASFADSDPIRLLGQQVGNVSCPRARLALGADMMVVCPHWTALASPSGVVEVASVYGPGNSVVDAYAGPLPNGLAWGDTIDQTWAALGRPNHITSVYGTPTLVYFFSGERYGSLEFRFDAGDRLTRVNASLVH